MNELDLNRIIHTNVAQMYSFHCNNVNTLFHCICWLFAKYLCTMCRCVLSCVAQNDQLSTLNQFVLENIIQFKRRMFFNTQIRH